MTAAAFEQKLAGHGAPALMGIKPANIITFSIKNEEEGIRLSSLIKDYNEMFCGKDLSFFVLCQCPVSCLVMVYRPSALEKQMKRKEVTAILRKWGYRTDSLEDMLVQLGKKIGNHDTWGFPHEIGLFLGYPVEDVIGFMKHKGKDYLYACYWKVYSDVERAKSWCMQWEAARNKALQAVDSGRTISEILKLEEAA